MKLSNLAKQVLQGLLLCVTSAALAGQVGNYPNAAPLNGNERIVADQADPGPSTSGVTVNITPNGIYQFLFPQGYLPSSLMPILIGDCATTNGSFSITCTKSNGVPFSALATNPTASAIVALFASCSGTNYLGADGNCHNAGGTVTSVGLTMPSIFTVTGTPVTTSGAFGVSLNGQSQNQALMSPNGAGGVPAFRALVSADLPLIPLSTGITGTLGAANGGSGEAGTITGVLKANAGSAYTGALASDIILLWSGTCSASTWLRGDGNCSAISLTGITGLGTGVATALADNVGSAGGFVVNGGVLGTPSSGTATNLTGLPVSTGLSGLGTGVAGALADSVGSAGAVVVNGGVLGTPSSGSAINLTNFPTLNQNTTGNAATATSATTATNLAGGAANEIHYQTAAGTSSFIAAPSSANTFLEWTGSAFTFASAGGSSPGGSSYSLQYNNSGTLGGVLPGTTGVYCLDWASLSSAPTLTTSCPTSGGSTVFQTNGVALASDTTVNYQNSAATNGLTLTFTNPSAGNVQLGLSGTLTNAGLTNSSTTVNGQNCTLGSTCTVPFDTNSVANTSQAGINLETSTTNAVGLTVTPTNSATNVEKFEVTGTYTGPYAASGLTGLGTGVGAALADNVGSAGAFVVNGGAGGTPSSLTLTNATGLPISTGVSGLGTGVATFLATPSSANLATALTDETGSGHVVYSTSPSLTTPAITGSSTGLTTIASANASATSYTATLPAATDTIAEIAATQTLTNKSIAASEVNSGTLAAAQMPALTGDVTSSAGSVATTIAAGAVTLAKQANFAASSLMGNPTGSSAAPSAITLGAGLSFSGTTLVASGGAATAITPGTTTVVGATAPCLIDNSASTTMGCAALAPTLALTSGTLGTTTPNRTVTASPTVASTDMGGVIYSNVSGGGTITIPAISSTVFASGMTLTIVNYSASTAAISTTPTVNAGGGCVSGTGIPAGDTWELVSNGTSIDCNQTLSAASGGSGTVASSTTGQVPVYTGSTTVTGSANATLTAGALTLGVSGTPGSVKMGNATSGTLTLQPATGALGAVIVSVPAATDTLVNLTGTQTLTNKSIAASEVNSGQLAVANGGSGAATLTGPIKGNGTSAFSAAVASDIYGLWSGTCSSSTYLRGDGSCQAPSGSGTVNSATSGDIAAYLATGTAVSGVPISYGLGITASGLFLYQNIDAQTGTSSTIAAGDYAKLVTFSNASAVAVTLPVATTTGFGAGFFFIAQNTGAGTVTITPTTSTINGSATLTLSQNEGCNVTSDGTNYQVSACTALGTLPASAAVLASNSSRQPVALTLGNNLAVVSNVLETTQAINAQTGTSYTLQTTDAGKLVTSNNASAVAWTLPVATTSGFTAGYSFDVQNIGAGTITITPTTSTINGAATLTIAQNTGCTVTSDGTNYQISACTAKGGGGSGTVGSGTTNQIPYYAASGTTLTATTTLPTAAMPALTGDVTNTAGSLATTVGKVNGAAVATSAAVAATNSSGQIIAATTLTYLLDEGTKFTVSSGTGACATTSTLVGGTTVGSVVCTGTSGASTLVITLPSAPNSIWMCKSLDKTTPADSIPQTGYTATTATFGGTIVANDVIAFACTGS